VVCGNYPLKEDGMGTVLPQSESTERFVPVPMAPAGFMCIKRNVLETMRERLPELSLTR